MKLGPVTKLGKKNKTALKNFDDDVMSENCNVTVIYQIFCQFGVVQMLDCGHKISKSYVFINNVLFYKNRKQN